MTFAVKDLIDVEGVVTGGGNPRWAETHPPATADAWVVRRLREAGASVAGKTITDELAFSLEGENAHHGTPLNPRAPDRLPGGSSSGSASAVAAQLVDFALGTDTGGSVRVPASFCGVFGFRPSHGAVPLDGVMPFAPSLDTVGWMTRDAWLLERVGDVLLPADGGAAPDRPHEPEWQLFFAEDVFAMAQPECADRVRACARALGLGIPQSIHVFDAPAQDWLSAYATLQGAEIARELGPWIAANKPVFGPALAPRFDSVFKIESSDVARWQRFRVSQSARLGELLVPGTVLVWPTTPGPALLKTASEAERQAFYQTALAVNAIAGLAGLPQVTIPLSALSAGKADFEDPPLGLSLVGPRGCDRALLRLAASLLSAQEAAR